MKFSSSVPFEWQEMLLKQLKEYERGFKDMTRKERHLLHMWVRKGNSPYENGDYVCDDNCKPMDFVSTLRFWEEMQEYYNSLSEEEKLEFTDEGTLSYEDIPDGTDESGFDIPTDLLEKVISEVPF